MTITFCRGSGAKVLMQVEKVYRDSEGNWHIDYSSEHLIGLAIRVYICQFALGLYILISFIILAVLF